MRKFLAKLLLGNAIEDALMNVQEARTCAEALMGETPDLPAHNWDIAEIQHDMWAHFYRAEKILGRYL